MWVQHKRMAAGHRTFIFKSFSICSIGGRIFRVSLMPSQRSVWTGISPNPNLPARDSGRSLSGQRAGSRRDACRAPRSAGEKRQHLLSASAENCSRMDAVLYDDTGRAYLDVYNTVPLVGHSHPRVVQRRRRSSRCSTPIRGIFTTTSTVTPSG